MTHIRVETDKTVKGNLSYLVYDAHDFVADFPYFETEEEGKSVVEAWFKRRLDASLDQDQVILQQVTIAGMINQLYPNSQEDSKDIIAREFCVRNRLDFIERFKASHQKQWGKTTVASN